MTWNWLKRAFWKWGAPGGQQDDRHRWEYAAGVVWFNSIILLDDYELGSDLRRYAIHLLLIALLVNLR